MINDVAPLGGQSIGKAASREDAWWLCSRYGLMPFPLNDVSAVSLEAAENGAKVWTVPCEHTKYPYDRAAFENRRRDGLATLENGLPAWPVAEENGIAFQTFKQRLKRGWSGERAATEGVNVQISLEHLLGLEDAGLEAFVEAVFSRSGDYRGEEWQDRVSSSLQTLLNLSHEQQVSVGESALAVSLFCAPFARWDEKEAVKNLFAERLEVPEFCGALEACADTMSARVNDCLAEIREGNSSP